MLVKVIRYLYPDLQLFPNGPVQIVDRADGMGAQIAVWRDPRPQPTPAEIAAAELPSAKAAAIAANRAECSARIYARYPPGRQLSALAGLYDSANVATMTDWIAANISAENTAADLIEAATTVQAVEAVSVSWPA
jgi:hypothetical protein